MKLAVYTVDGRHVVTLAEGIRQAGPHLVPWQGRDAAGRPVSSGHYFYRLDVDGQQMTRGMVLLK